MTPELGGALFQEGLVVLATAGGPLFLALLVSGLALGILQATTQINDTAVGFLPRIAIALGVIWAMGGWMMHRFAAYFARALAAMAGGGS
jgi:flagellar biosynthetic protein FliQ